MRLEADYIIRSSPNHQYLHQQMVVACLLTSIKLYYRDVVNFCVRVNVGVSFGAGVRADVSFGADVRVDVSFAAGFVVVFYVCVGFCFVLVWVFLCLC